MENLKFYYNGLRFNGELFRGFYSPCHCGENDGCISFYGRDYKRLPQAIRGILKVQNESDIMIDYFEHDRFKVKPRDEYYQQILEALQACEKRREKKRERKAD